MVSIFTDYSELKLGNNNTPTLVIPGFGMSNASTFVLRKILMDKGHNVIPWTINRNLGFNPENIDETFIQVVKLSESYGTKINIIGQSLGGCYARMIGNKIPDRVTSVITLGSPINGVDLVSTNSISRYNKMTGIIDAAVLHHTEYLHEFKPNPPVFTTSIFSKNDEVVAWPLSIIDETEMSENVEVNSSHLSMGFNLRTIKILADRLSQNPEDWKPYNS